MYPSTYMIAGYNYILQSPRSPKLSVHACILVVAGKKVFTINVRGSQIKGANAVFHL